MAPTRLLKQTGSLFAVLFCCCASPVAWANTIWQISGVPLPIQHNIHKQLEAVGLSKPCRSAECLQRVRTQVKQAVLPFGYYQPNIRISEQVIRVSLGRPIKIAQIQLTINGPGRKIYHRMPRSLPIKVGDVFNSEKYLETKRLLLDYAEQQGYLRASFELSEAQVFPTRYHAIILLTLNTHQRYYFGSVVFTHSSYDPHFLSRYLPLKMGKPFDPHQLLTLTDRLNNSGYFNSVIVTPKVGESPQVPTTVYLEDKPSHQYTIGGGYGTDTGIRGRLSWQWLKVNPQGHRFQTIFQGSQTQNNLQAQYTIPGRQPDKSQTLVTANIFQLNYPVGNSHALRLSLNHRFQDNRWLYNYGLYGLHESFNYIGGNKHYQRLLYPSLRLSWRDIHSPLFSKTGIKLYGETRTGIDGLGSSISFWQIQAGIKAAAWLPSDSRLVGRIDWDVTATDDIYHLPLSLQQLAGGIDSLRGYQYQSVGPGKRLLVGSIEWQQAIKADWYVCGFYDIGDVYIPASLSFKRGYGLGIMWTSPLGPLRAYVAKALDDVGQPYRFVFSVGPDL